MPFEHARRSVTRVFTIRKPFDVLAEGLLSEKSRENKTSFELFIAGIQGWETGFRREIRLQSQ
jgi:hypothetical protein